MPRPKRYWRIRGHKGFDTVMDERIPFGAITEKKVKDLLKCLVAKEGLSYHEMVGAYARRNSKCANNLLWVEKYGPYQYSCGNDPYFIADVVDEKGDRLQYPSLGA